VGRRVGRGDKRGPSALESEDCVRTTSSRAIDDRWRALTDTERPASVERLEQEHSDLVAQRASELQAAADGDHRNGAPRGRAYIRRLQELAIDDPDMGIWNTSSKNCWPASRSTGCRASVRTAMSCPRTDGTRLAVVVPGCWLSRHSSSSSRRSSPMGSARSCSISGQWSDSAPSFLGATWCSLGTRPPRRRADQVRRTDPRPEARGPRVRVSEPACWPPFTR
jgi:hypothetical protein